MRTRGIHGSALLIAIVVSLGAYAAEDPATAKETAKPDEGVAGGAPTGPAALAQPSVHVPKSPLDVLRRYFDLDVEQQKQLTEMRQQWYLERQEAIAEVESQLNAKYTGILLARLPGELGERFGNVQAAIDAYYEKLRDIDRDAREEWKTLFGEETRYVPAARSQIFYLLPGLSEEKRRQLQTELVRGTYQEALRRAREQLAEQGIVQPTDRKEREALQEYYRKSAELRNRIKEEVEAEKLEQIKAGFTDEQRGHYEGAVAIIDSRNGKREKAREELEEVLREIVSLERLHRPVHPYRETRRTNPGTAR